ncbi:MAG: amidohydrolase family protein [Pirellulaceae bacterium]|nr:amidohydrolase family protein [Pirellulaceae bacterium]
MVADVRRLGIFAALLLAASTLLAAPPSTAPVIGLRENTPAVHALVNLRIVPEPGKVIEKGTIILRDGVIEAVGADIVPPADARVWNLAGHTAYAGLIDAYSEFTIADDPRGHSAAHWNRHITPQLDVAEHYTADDALNAKFRGQGVAARLVVPATRIIKGQSALVTTGSSANSRAILKSNVAQHFRLTVAFPGSREVYPGSPMGAVALARQTLLDAEWYAKAWAAARGNSQLPRPERNDALAALAPLLVGNQPAIFDAANEQFFARADSFAREFGIAAIIRGSGREYRRLDEIRASGRAVIVPVNFPAAPNVGTVEQALDVSLQQLMHWDHAPENPARLDGAGVPIALTAHGLKDPADFLQEVRRAVVRGLKPDSALKALTITPATLVGMSDRIGKLAPGMIANVVVADGDLFAEKTKVAAVWIDGQRFEFDKPPPTDLRGSWRLEIIGADDRVLRLEMALRGTAKQLTGTLTKPAGMGVKRDEIKLTAVSLKDAQLGFRFEGKALGHDGPARATLTISADKGEQRSALGTIIWADGSSEKLAATRTSRLPKAEEPAETKPEPKTAAESPKSNDGKQPDDSQKPAPQPRETPAVVFPKTEEDAPSASQADAPATKTPAAKVPATPALFPVNYPLGDFGCAALPDEAKLVAFTNATLWTCGKAGVVERGTLLVRAGKIVAAGSKVKIPAGATVIDVAGRHISPGIIDCHSHMATDGGINEPTQAITAEVRVGDFIDADDISIYRQLAGGVTTSNILHGSANPIGGQNQVIKLRWGQPAEKLKFAAAPAGIKFALGENVKQSNWGEQFTSRYPQSRMGVEQLIRDGLAAARDYRQAHERWNTEHDGLPPRRDLELEALAEVLAGRRWIHCHSYRQDEILAFLRVCEDFQVKIGSLQHILEGYKVADAMARHGATGSSFADWWAYKFEVFDAIPHNGALMHRAGVIVSFNSDDAELARHLNHEAAKAVKYGGVPAEEALKFVTLNAAKQLRIDPWVGSLEAGKEADFVVWSGPPLSTLSRCEETWVDGRRYFSRETDRALRLQQAQMRAALIRKILDSGLDMQKPGDDAGDGSELWPRHDEYCHHGHDHDDE